EFSAAVTTCGRAGVERVEAHDAYSLLQSRRTQEGYGDHPGAQTERRGGAGPVRTYLAASPHRPILFQEPGEEMVPSKTPMVSPVTTSFKRVPVKLPVEPANRPVPPV